MAARASGPGRSLLHRSEKTPDHFISEVPHLVPEVAELLTQVRPFPDIGQLDTVLLSPRFERRDPFFKVRHVSPSPIGPPQPDSTASDRTARAAPKCWEIGSCGWRALASPASVNARDVAQSDHPLVTRLLMTSNRFLCAAVVVSAALTVACGGSAPPEESKVPPVVPAAAPVAAGWKATEGIATPESVYVDEGSGFIFTSQIDGEPGARDGNGRIVQLARNGRVVASDWVAGLNAPKGLRSYGRRLWTADLDEVVGIEIANGRVTSRTKIDGAMLNDVAVGRDGTVYVSDMMANRIHAIRDGQATVFAEGEQLEWPNGLLVDGTRLIVGGWGKPKPDFSTEVPGHLFALDLQTKQKTLITPNPIANIDGVELDGRGGYIVSDFRAGKILQVAATGEVRELRQFMPGTADIAFLPKQNILIVPHMNENLVASYDLSDDLK
jgi:hypothetical protein